VVTIEAVEAVPFRIPLRRHLEYAVGGLDAAEHVLVRVWGGDGFCGVAEAIPRPLIYGETVASVLAAIEQFVAPAVVGLEPLAFEQARFRLRHVAGNVAAKSSVEHAMLDLAGKALGVSCHRLLGGFADSVECTHVLFHGTPEEVTAEALRIRGRHGIRSFKPKVGLDLEQDVAVVLALREALGPDAILCPDANQGYLPAEAAAFLERTRPAGLAWLEEPCTPAARLERRRLADRGPVPLMGDDTCTSPEAVAAEVTDGRCSVVSIKTARTGVAGSRAIRDLCTALGASVAFGTQGETALGVLSAAAFVASHPATLRHPAELTYFLELEDDLVVRPPEIAGGRLSVPRDEPGFGFELDEAKLDAYRVSVPAGAVS
jgi:L-alanine-DL-glutamate epimerase-like enolase superfamily enzyme